MKRITKSYLIATALLLYVGMSYYVHQKYHVDNSAPKIEQTSDAMDSSKGLFYVAGYATGKTIATIVRAFQ